jgi:phosphatidylglycerol:prolipoprotein diacylglycerol transferase
MFPTLADLLKDLFHIQVWLPIRTFGFFVALAFVAAYYVFVSEFKRKEKDGLIHSFNVKAIKGKAAVRVDLLVNGILGFLFGYKFVGVVFFLKQFKADPAHYIFSTRGSFIFGLFVAAGFICWLLTDHYKNKADAVAAGEKMVHPYQLMSLIVFSVGVTGFIGAKLFDILEHFDVFLLAPFTTLFNTYGLTYYGGLVFGGLTYFYIGRKHGMKAATLGDICSPGMMLAYGVGRIGCHLSGDGDWGIVNLKPKPSWLGRLPDWMWSFRFPHNVINAGIPMKDCFGNYCNELVYGVYPTSFYEAVACIGLFILMWVIRKYITTPGLMSYLFLIPNGSERLLAEIIRINPRYQLFNIYFTQAELICAFFLAGGVWRIVSIAYRKKLFRTTVIIS